ncbi:hypothetical protein VTO42DRAFT_7608 [Malbranchea cinnamomea]
MPGSRSRRAPLRATSRKNKTRRAGFALASRGIRGLRATCTDPYSLEELNPTVVSSGSSPCAARNDARGDEIHENRRPRGDGAAAGKTAVVAHVNTTLMQPGDEPARIGVVRDSVRCAGETETIRRRSGTGLPSAARPLPMRSGRHGCAGCRRLQDSPSPSFARPSSAARTRVARPPPPAESA